MADTLTTTNSYDRTLEALSVVKANLAGLASLTSTIQAMLLAMNSSTTYNQAALSLYWDRLLEVQSTIDTQRQLADTAVTNVQLALTALNELIAGSSGQLTYKAVVTELNSLRDACVDFYDLSATLAKKVSDAEDSKVITHLIQAWPAVHGNTTFLLSTYSDSAENVVGDTVMKLSFPNNSIAYRFTQRDTEANAVATTLYAPGVQRALPVTNSLRYERCSSPFVLDGTELPWLLYLPPEVRGGCFQKYAFVGCGSSGVQRWQYCNSSGTWVTIADLAVMPNVSYYAAYSGSIDMVLAAQDGGTSATVTYAVAISRTAHGGCARFEPKGSLYPPENRVFVAGLRVLILNDADQTCHRTVVTTTAARDAIVAPVVNERVYVNDEDTQYYWTGTTWATSADSDTVDQVTFSGIGIYRQYCSY